VKNFIETTISTDLRKLKTNPRLQASIVVKNLKPLFPLISASRPIRHFDRRHYLAELPF
jgi:hypothetical protein